MTERDLIVGNLYTPLVSLYTIHSEHDHLFGSVSTYIHPDEQLQFKGVEPTIGPWGKAYLFTIERGRPYGVIREEVTISKAQLEFITAFTPIERD